MAPTILRTELKNQFEPDLPCLRWFFMNEQDKAQMLELLTDVVVPLILVRVSLRHSSLFHPDDVDEPAQWCWIRPIYKHDQLDCLIYFLNIFICDLFFLDNWIVGWFFVQDFPFELEYAFSDEVCPFNGGLDCILRYLELRPNVILIRPILVSEIINNRSVLYNDLFNLIRCHAKFAAY